MKRIPLHNGKLVIVDDEDYPYLAQFSWREGPKGYAERKRRIADPPGGNLVFMHREIARTPTGMLTDHINGLKYDNRRCNLRICTHAQNMQNRTTNKAGKTSLFKGVFLDKGKWRAAVGRRRLGFFVHEKDAALAYDKVALEMFGEFALLNFPDATPEERKWH